MGVTTGCGCKEYRVPHTTYPYSSCICSFLQQHPYFLFIFKMFFVLVYDKSKDAVFCYTCLKAVQEKKICVSKLAFVSLL